MAFSGITSIVACGMPKCGWPTNIFAASSAEFAWTFWKLDWGTPASGPHTVTSRTFDVDGHQQPPPDDPFLASKRTYWESNGQITRRVTIP